MFKNASAAYNLPTITKPCAPVCRNAAVKVAATGSMADRAAKEAQGPVDKALLEAQKIIRAAINNGTS